MLEIITFEEAVSEKVALMLGQKNPRNHVIGADNNQGGRCRGCQEQNYGLNNRLNLVGKVAGTTMGLVASLIELVQLAGERTQVSCKMKPGVFGAHEMVALPGVAGTIVSVGARVTHTEAGKAQKPPVTEYWTLTIGPPMLVLQPTSTVNQSIENGRAKTGRRQLDRKPRCNH
jgi:hypothetical protein